jgi:hypothetical protein
LYLRIGGEQVVSREDGYFKKGHSGNPGGRPKVVAEVRDLARQHTTDAINTLATIMTNEDAHHSARVAAANALLDRGYGKAQANVEITGNVASEFSAFLRSLDEPREQTAATARLPQGVKRLN